MSQDCDRRPDEHAECPDGAPAGSAGFETVCGHLGEDRLSLRGAAAPPLFQTSTFIYPDAESFEGRDRSDSPHYDYTRLRNPTIETLETKLARLEHGRWARCFASGMGAITAAVNLGLSAGSHVVAMRDCYKPTRRYLSDYLSRFGVSVTYVPEIDAQRLIAAMRDETRLVYLESPTTGWFEVIDVPPITAEARRRGILTIFDNSWATPYFQQPLDLGCDLVLHSATKYIGGHSDALGGVVVGRDAELRGRLLQDAELLGAPVDPFAAWLLLRGLRTLAIRMEQHQRSGLALAHMLAEHPAVLRVYHPGLETYEQREIVRRQFSGCAGMFGFALRDQGRAATHRFIDRLRVFSIGCSWGGHESLVVGGKHNTLFADAPERPEWLIRLHAGLETTEDLVSDVRQALED